MVGPILISVAVTPRISAAIEAQGKASTASAPSLVTKRIDASPRLFRRAQTATAAGAVRPRSPHAETCHDGRMDANRNHYETEAKSSLWQQGRDYFGRLLRWSFGMTNFNPDQTSSIAQTLMSTRPSGSAVSRTTTSVRSVATPEALFGHDTQIMPSGSIAAR